MRWVLLAVAVLGFALAFSTHSPGLLGLGLLLGFGGLIGFALALAAARIASVSQPDNALIIDPEVNALREKARQAKPKTAGTVRPTPKQNSDSTGSGS